MAIANTLPAFTAEEYLAQERAASFKSELIDGRIVAMAGASRAHNVVAFNILGELRPQLKGRRCEAYGSDMRVEIAAAGLYTYPDASVVCGQPRFGDAHGDTLQNPTVIFEILSPTTEAYDRGEKFARYRRLDSLEAYVLVSQAEMRVEWYTRQPGSGTWLYNAVEGGEATVALASIGCTIALREVYDKVWDDVLSGVRR